MRALSRRAAIGATTVALVLAAAGTSLATIRSTQYEGGVTPAGLALRAPSGTRPVSDPTLPPTSDIFVPDAELPSTAGSDGAASDAAAAGIQASPGAASTTSLAGSASSPRAPAAAVDRPAAAAAARAVRPTLSTLPPASGPTPTTSPVRPAATTCPINEPKGALPVRSGPLKAVNFALRWPSTTGALVLVPQPTAARSGNAPVTIADTTAPLRAIDGTSLTLTAPIGITYTLQSGHERANGTVRFTSVAGPDVSLSQPVCRNASFVLHDVKRASLRGSPVRIIGMVAPPGMVAITADGGTAFFSSASAGAHRITLLTATDAGEDHQIIEVTVIVA